MPAAGVPARVAVPSPLSVKRHAGRQRAGLGQRGRRSGSRVRGHREVPAEPTVNVVWLALVIAGGSVTVSVKVWVAFGGTPLLAVKVSG